MKDAPPNAVTTLSRSTPQDRSPTVPLVAAAVMAAVLAATGAWGGTWFGVMGGMVVAGLAAPLSVFLGYGIGRRWGPFPAHVKKLMFRVADELAQYRAFTRLLRDQGSRITETTEDAATVIVSGLRDMDAKVALVVAQLEMRLPAPDGEQLQRMALSISDPVIEMLGKLQFQDVTRQQLAFLSNLSLVVDEHMIDLAHQLGDRRSLDRVGEFKQMFDRALDDCVMTSQRDDHHIASGIDQKEASEPKIELF